MDKIEFENSRWKDDQKIQFRHKIAKNFVEKYNVSTFLDMGCGDGLLLEFLKNTNGMIGKGVDISDVGVKKTTDKGFEAQVWSSGEKTIYNDGEFDCVISLDVMEHLRDPNDYLREANRVSKKGIIISVPNFNSFPARIQCLFGKVPENNKHHKGHCYWYNLEKLKLVLSENGFVIKELRVNTFVEKIFGVFGKIFPSLFGLSFLVYAEKK